MPGISGSNIDAPVTPYRYTELELDIPQHVSVRPPWALSRSADQMGRTEAAGSVLTTASSNVMLVPGPAWILRPVAMAPDQLLTTVDAGPISDWNLAENFTTKKWWKAPTDILDGVGGSLLATGDHCLIKQVDLGSGTYSSELAPDVLAFPKPVTGTETLQLRRIAASRTTFPANTAFRVVFLTPPALALGSSSLLTFYFGGPCDVSLPIAATAGQFAAHLYGSGDARLFEWDGVAWKDRLAFRWSSAGYPQGGLHVLDFLPYDHRNIAIRAQSSGSALSLFHVAGAQYAPSAPLSGWSHYQNVPEVTGIRVRRTMTGAGITRVDLREDLRLPIWVWAHRYPERGTDGILNDGPFNIDSAPPAETLITQHVHAYTLQDAGVQASLYSANTLTELDAGTAEHTWKSTADSLRYYGRFRLIASTDRFNTPVLYGAQWSVPGETAQLSPTPVTGGNIRSVNATGPDLDPSHESLSLEIQDPSYAVGGLLETRGGFFFRVTTRYDALEPTLKSTLFEGMVAQARGRQRGRSRYRGLANQAALAQFPSANWKAWDFTGVGMWGRIAEQLSLNQKCYALDPNGGVDPETGEPRPWKITDILKDLLQLAGWPEAALDIGDETLRLFPVRRPQDLILTPEAMLADVIRYLCELYLGRYLIYDPNARGAGLTVPGMWRLLDNPTSEYAAIWSFEDPELTLPARALPACQSSYETGYSFIQDGSYVEYVKRPDFNFVTVTATASLVPNSSGAFKGVVHWHNELSFDLDPSNPTANPSSIDYLGRRVDYIFCDPLLQTDHALEWVAERLLAIGGTGQRWATFRAPAVLFTNPSDPYQFRPRPLRLNDVIKVKGQKAIVRSVNLDYTSDRAQMAQYEVLYAREAG